MPPASPLPAPHRFRAICFDWGGTLMGEDGPGQLAMADWPQVQVLPGAAELLAALHGSCPLCIATNAAVSTRHDIERALERGGLLRFIDEIFSARELGCRKDQPAFWAAVSQRLQVPLHDVAMLGDSLEQDVLAPRRQGLYTVWFNPGGLQHANAPQVPVVRRLADVPPLLAAAAATETRL